MDHVVPHSAGGTNDPENLVTACWSCQFRRGAWSLEEVGLFDPRDRPLKVDDWDGHTRLLTRPVRRAVAAALIRSSPRPRRPPAMCRRLRRGRPVCRKASGSRRSTRYNRSPSSRLTGFVDRCVDLGVSWKLKDVLLVRMTVGDEDLDIIGVQKDGLCEIPWSIGGAKDAFKGFAETLAAGIPGAVFYETAKMWVVSKPDKKRINLLELLEALPALRRGLEELLNKSPRRRPRLTGCPSVVMRSKTMGKGTYIQATRKLREPTT